MKRPSGHGKKAAAGFGKVLRHLRKERGLLQTDIAEGTGVNQSQIPKWERERQGMRLDSLVEVLEALDTGMEEFGRLFDRSRRGEPLVAPETDDEVTAAQAGRQNERELPTRRGRAAVFLWEEEGERLLSHLAPEAQNELDSALTELRYALDQLQPPEERLLPDEEREVANGNGEDAEE